MLVPANEDAVEEIVRASTTVVASTPVVDLTGDIEEDAPTMDPIGVEERIREGKARSSFKSFGWIAGESEPNVFDEIPLGAGPSAPTVPPPQVGIPARGVPPKGKWGWRKSPLATIFSNALEPLSIRCLS